MTIGQIGNREQGLSVRTKLNTTIDRVNGPDTVAALKLLSIESGVLTDTKGYVTSGDGGSATYLIKTSAEFGGTPDGFGDHTLANGNVAVLQNDGIELHVKRFGAVGDGLVNDFASIDACITVAENIGGANIIYGDGSYRIESKLNVNGSNIVFIASGWNGFHDAGGSTFSARLIWHGATGGTMVEFSPIEGASNGKLVGCGNQGVTFEGRNVAGNGLVVKSHNNGRWDFHAQQFTLIAVNFDVVTTLGEARDCQLNSGHITVRQIGSTGIGVVVDGVAAANYSLNLVSFEIQHEDATAYVAANSDNSMCPSLRVIRAAGGTGIGVIFEGGDTQAESARDDLYLYFNPGAGGVIIRGTSSFTVASKNERVLHFDDQAAGAIVIEAGASFFYTKNDNTQVNAIISQLTIGNSPSGAKNEFDNISNQTVRMVNGASNHSALVDLVGNEWRINIDGVTGDLRIQRFSGSGALLLDQPLKLTGQTTTTSSPASGAAGALPANPEGYLDVTINGTLRKLPFYL